ncbi:MAG: YIP1 family protein, partial [Candidatus Aminicenantes bacterium]|nr:YIP1 family protein [Candidatus Aminicenantes bacterium]
MTFPQRLTGVFANPRPTFQDIAAKPAWTVALIVLILLAVVTTYLITPIAQKDQLQMMKDNVKLKDRLGEERFNRMIQSMENPSPVRQAIQTFVVGPLFLVIGLLFQSVILLVMGRFVSTQGSYNQVFGSLIYASFVDKLLGN